MYRLPLLVRIEARRFRQRIRKPARRTRPHDTTITAAPRLRMFSSRERFDRRLNYKLKRNELPAFNRYATHYLTSAGRPISGDGWGAEVSRQIRVTKCSFSLNAKGYSSACM